MINLSAISMNSLYTNPSKMAEINSAVNIQKQVDGKIHVSENAFQAANAESLKSVFAANELPETSNISKDKKGSGSLLYQKQDNQKKQPEAPPTAKKLKNLYA